MKREPPKMPEWYPDRNGRGDVVNPKRDFRRRMMIRYGLNSGRGWRKLRKYFRSLAVASRTGPTAAASEASVPRSVPAISSVSPS